MDYMNVERKKKKKKSGSSFRTTPRTTTTTTTVKQTIRGKDLPMFAAMRMDNHHIMDGDNRVFQPVCERTTDGAIANANQDMGMCSSIVLHDKEDGSLPSTRHFAHIKSGTNTFTTVNYGNESMVEGENDSEDDDEDDEGNSVELAADFEKVTKTPIDFIEPKTPHATPFPSDKTEADRMAEEDAQEEADEDVGDDVGNTPRTPRASPLFSNNTQSIAVVNKANEKDEQIDELNDELDNDREEEEDDDFMPSYTPHATPLPSSSNLTKTMNTVEIQETIHESDEEGEEEEKGKNKEEQEYLMTSNSDSVSEPPHTPHATPIPPANVEDAKETSGSGDESKEEKEQEGQLWNSTDSLRGTPTPPMDEIDDEIAEQEVQEEEHSNSKEDNKDSFIANEDDKRNALPSRPTRHSKPSANNNSPDNWKEIESLAMKEGDANVSETILSHASWVEIEQNALVH
eukprot:m.45826 g.45826  ORF g.45826 m.45826 type:complete len:458 (-) comp7237_c1_seq1:424-1797(-)